MSERRKFSVAALLEGPNEVQVGPDLWMPIKPLSLREIISLFLENANQFMSLYAATMGQSEREGTKGEKNDMEVYATFLVSAPEMVARIIAIASESGEEPETIKAIETRMAGTVQLIALAEIMKWSVPDPKKFVALLSEVMGHLQKHNEKLAKEAQKLSGQTNSSPQ